MLSILDIFKVGIGPSSSHTVGPMRIGRRFMERAARRGHLGDTVSVHIYLYGSLALTGIGHGTDTASMLGLMGARPDKILPRDVEAMLAGLRETGKLKLHGGPDVAFDEKQHIHFITTEPTPLHPNKMRLELRGVSGETLFEHVYYSTGGGFISTEKQLKMPAKKDLISDGAKSPLPFGSGAELLAICDREKLTIANVVMSNEDGRRSRAKTDAGLDHIWEVMSACIDRGLSQRGVLPGGLHVKRRAPDIWDKLQNSPGANEREQLFDWLNVYAMAVNEENAAGGRVVTAPTNGAAGIIPAVIRHYGAGEGTTAEMRRIFLLTAGGIGLLYKQRASISGAEMGCQGEVGVACSMAAGGLAAMWGATPRQIEHAAEIGMEHNLGLTCDPVGGLVQIPCIERNAIGSVKAVNAARLAMHDDGTGHKVSLDQVIETMRQTGLDMSHKYKETSQGGLAVNVIAC
ncbi:L-serine ammonia-lyase [Robiginitomaculum antarcticum]|uniref:L-serine ammonia-lyase n=1 Tax=Robiginitomaculum antarcticum TaxID=437507 RepID=UPI00036297D8|nr:L-serine ammonia-lyase [Robiginitomaculum antarcticum]